MMPWPLLLFYIPRMRSRIEMYKFLIVTKKDFSNVTPAVWPLTPFLEANVILDIKYKTKVGKNMLET